ncbi:MAG: PRC-barrel domain-containing protein [Rickettsiales bacterium]
MTAPLTTNCIFSASEIEGTDVVNAQGESLGDIKDVVFCAKTHRVQYYVLSFGGILGIGDKLFAIPPEAVAVDADSECIVLNVPKERLENAEGFDRNNRPNFADPSFRQRNDAQYGYPQAAATAQPGTKSRYVA